MKQLILLVIVCTFIACKKQEPEQIDPQTPVEVFYKVKGSHNTPKRVTCYLWNSNQERETLELVGKIDTIITDAEAILSITQNHIPYIYAKITFEVEVLNGSDNLEISVYHSNQAPEKIMLNRYASCPVASMSFEDEYTELYKQNQQKVK
jgi:hypothetical protein